MSYSQNKNIAPSIIETIEGVPFEMILVKGGSFLMGLQSDDKNAENFVNPWFYKWMTDTSSYNSDFIYPTHPVHLVQLPDFYIGKYPVTQGQWKAVVGNIKKEIRYKNFFSMIKKLKLQPRYSLDWESLISNNPSCFHRWDDLPVESVSLFDIQSFLKKLQHITHKDYRLPSESEWEFAAGDGLFRNPFLLSKHKIPDNLIPETAICTSSVFDGKPNKLGICNMLDNVFEWCQDIACSYPTFKQTDSMPFSMKYNYIQRGSNFENLIQNDLNGFIFFRFASPPEIRDEFTGFRLALSIK
jgi:formylglycine-generating enzyme required for sulfatase activity